MKTIKLFKYSFNQVRILAIVIIALFSIIVSSSAQVKVYQNGKVTMSKDLIVAGKSAVKLSNSHDLTETALNTSSPTNSISLLQPYRIQSLQVVPMGLEGDAMEINSMTPGMIGDLETMQDHYGFNINEFRLVYPELVNYDTNNQPYINYTELIPILVQSIKELTIRVNQLENVGLLPPIGDDPIMLHAPRQNDATTDIADAKTNNDSRLYQNTPNPFNERTIIRYDIPQSANNAYLCIYDMQGTLKKQIIADVFVGQATIEAGELPAGMYLYTLFVDNREVATRRMILSK